jgi:hypothetical protein
MGDIGQADCYTAVGITPDRGFESHPFRPLQTRFQSGFLRFLSVQSSVVADRFPEYLQTAAWV